MGIETLKEPNQAAHDYVYRGLRTRIMHGEILPATSMTLRGIGKDYSKLAAFLLGEDNKWITGQIIHVDGGRSTLRKKG